MRVVSIDDFPAQSLVEQGDRRAIVTVEPV